MEPEFTAQGSAQSDGERMSHAVQAHREGRIAEAVDCYRRLLDPLAPSSDLLHVLGIGLGQLGHYDEAVTFLTHAATLNPRSPLIHCNLGNAHWGRRDAGPALRSYDQALLLDAEMVDAHCNRGKVLLETDQLELAIEAFNRTLRIDPLNAEALNGRGNALAGLGRNAEALVDYDEALRLKTEFQEAAWNKSLVLLRQGNFEEGWPLHSANPRYLSPNALRRFPDRPAWTGRESLTGKTIFLYSDQGYGDTIQYVRYAPTIQAQGARVIAQVPKALGPIMARLEGVDELVPEDQGPATFDFHCPWASLPSAFRAGVTAIPSNVPYLRADERDAEIWAARLGARRKLRVGLAWSGSRSHRQDRHRSTPLREFLGLGIAGFDITSLQPDIRDEDFPYVDQIGIRHFGSQIESFADTAALISLMDVVVAVDTAVAHLAGAMGANVWVLLPVVPDWRWLLNRSDSPWYPTARLFRQTQRGSWKRPISEICEKLRLVPYRA